MSPCHQLDLLLCPHHTITFTLLLQTRSHPTMPLRRVLRQPSNRATDHLGWTYSAPLKLAELPVSAQVVHKAWVPKLTRPPRCLLWSVKTLISAVVNLSPCLRNSRTRHRRLVIAPSLCSPLLLREWHLLFVACALWGSTARLKCRITTTPIILQQTSPRQQ